MQPGTRFAVHGGLLGLALVLMAPITVAAGLPEERVRAIDRFIQQFVDLAMFDGTVLVDYRGEIVYEKSFGYASYELGVTHDAQSRFRIASISKTLTDAAIATMIQREKLTLETPISHYLSDFPAGDTFTV